MDQQTLIPIVRPQYMPVVVRVSDLAHIDTRNAGTYPELVKSIRELGLLQAIGLNEDQTKLLYGYRRLEALREIAQETGEDVEFNAVVVSGEYNPDILTATENEIRRQEEKRQAEMVRRLCRTLSPETIRRDLHLSKARYDRLEAKLPGIETG